MIDARTAYNPPDFTIDPAMLNPWTNPAISGAEGVKFALETGAIYGTGPQVAEEMAALRDAGIHHVLCQMSFGYLGHEKIMASMRRFGEQVIPALI